MRDFCRTRIGVTYYSLSQIGSSSNCPNTRRSSKETKTCCINSIGFIVASWNCIESTESNLNRRDCDLQRSRERCVLSSACGELCACKQKLVFESGRATNLQRWISKSTTPGGTIKRDFITVREFIKMHARTDECSARTSERLNPSFKLSG